MRIKYLKTENRLYTEHLEAESKSTLFFPAAKNLTPSSKSIQIPGFQTNYSIILKNQYVFVLLHLKKGPNTKNFLSILTPDVCIFYNHQPYEIIYCENGEIRGFRGKETLRLKEIYSFFKNRWKLKGLNKEEPCVACFDQEQYLMMSDTDLFITCRKFKNDPFFSKISYIRNKINAADNPIKVEYDQLEDTEFTGIATQSLLNIQNQAEILKDFGEYKYLRYCNAKICLFLNYEHNIRVNKGFFYYLRNNKDEYLLVNVSNLEYTNLTNAIKERQKRMKAMQSKRNQCLIMSADKAERYKKHQNSPKVEIIQNSMNESWVRIANSLRIKTNQERIQEQKRNQQAFHILYPSLQKKFDVVLAENDFRQIKKRLLKLEQRRPLFKKTTNRLPFKSNRSKTQNIEFISKV